MKRLEELLAEALETPAEDRDAFLDAACRDNPELRQEVGELLGLHAEAADFFDGLASDIAAAAALELENAGQPTIEIAPYKTLAAIGRGGMGAVYLAERVDGAFDQKVALKLLHRDMDTPQLRARFLAERQLLARLSHPNIAHLLDGGVTDEGRPYFVMEYVEGVPITRYCADTDLSMEDVLRLFLVVIDAVSYLHRNLVVHRDLKPSNIFVDRDHQVKLLDFGIAKLLADEPEVGGGQTRTGEQLMTPEYAAPEQILAAPVTTATDVYALGVVLFELLTGRRPHDRTNYDRHSLSQELAPAPSSMLKSRGKKEGPTSPGQTDAYPSPETAVAWRRIAGDLDTICLMALRPETEARYPSAEQFGQDIERHLQGLPVLARKGTVRYRLGKFVKRHRRGLLAIVILLALAATGFVRERTLRGEAEQARIEAQQQAAKAVAVSSFLAELLSSVDPMKAQGQEITVAEVLDQAAARIADSTELTDQPTVEAAVRQTIGNTYVSLGKYPEAQAHLERALELRGGLESRDPEAVVAIANLGVLYSRLGLLDHSESLLLRVLEIRTETLGEDHLDTLRTFNELADLYWASGHYDKVEAIDRRTLEIRRRVLGTDHPDTLKSLNGLAASLFNGGRYAEAAPLFEEALAVYRQQHGELHPHTLTLGNNLAATYHALARYEEAESLLREVIAGRIQVLGQEHAETAMSVHNMGVLLAELARYEEATDHLRRAIAVRERLPGDSRDFLFSSTFLADVYRDQGRHEDAEALYQATLDQQRESHGTEDPGTLKTMSGLAEMRLRQGNLGAAEALLSETLDTQVRVRGETHQETLLSLITMARIRNAQGRFADALTYSDRVVAAGSPTLGADHPLVLEAIYERALALIGQQQPREAQQLAARIHEQRSHLLGEHHPQTVEAKNLLKGLQNDGGDSGAKISMAQSQGPAKK